MNLFDLLAISARRAPDKIALRYRCDDGRTHERTYAALLDEAERTAAALSREVAPGDRVAFFLGNRPEFVTALLACLRLGAVVVPINLAYRREILHIQGDAQPRLFLLEAADREVAQLVADHQSEPAIERFVFAEEMASWKADPADLPPRTALAGDDLAMILYTSGTTGKSKGAMIRHGNVLATITGLLAAWSWEREDVLLLTLPLFHVHGLIVGLLTALAAGATVELRRKFDAPTVTDELTGELVEGGPTVFFGVPTMYVRLVDELRRRRESGGDADLSRLRLFCSGSAPLDPETFRAFRELTGHAILERYGMTETGMSLSNPYVGERLPGTVGVPLPGVSARIVDPEGRDVPPGGEGELLVRGSNVFTGYWQAPEKTAESFVQDEAGDRWFCTGDLARRDPQTGHYTLLGRRHELILSGGFNVYPREVEEVLVTWPGVREAAVVGRRHPEWGEVPVAFIVADRADQDIDEAALVDYLKTQMAGFKVPRTLRFLESLPRNALGKVQKHLLPET